MNISVKGEACKSGIFQPRAGQRAEAKVGYHGRAPDDEDGSDITGDDRAR